MIIQNFNKVLIDKDKINEDLKNNFFLVKEIISKISETIEKKSKMYTCGNGGSAGDAQHMAAEGIVRLKPKINRKPIPIISLAMDTSTITACANDYGYEYIFSRPLEALGKKNDLLLCYSTSGKSKNIIQALKKAKKMKIFSICLLGGDGGFAKRLANISLIVKSNNVARIQETHIFLSHFILEEVEKRLIAKKKI
jgi:D-sedoheptulose 7-phosphate isomerase